MYTYVSIHYENSYLLYGSKYFLYDAFDKDIIPFLLNPIIKKSNNTRQML